MKTSGHETHSVFERYNIIDEATLTEAARKLDDKQNSNAPDFPMFGQSSGIVALEMVEIATPPPLAPLPN